MDTAPPPAVVSGCTVGGAQENKPTMDLTQPCIDVRGCDYFYHHLPHKTIATTNDNPRPLPSPRLVMKESMFEQFFL